MSRRKTQDEFVADVDAINPNIEVLGTYVNSRTKVHVKCRKCGHEWDPIPENIYRGHGCPKCGHRACEAAHRKTHEEFVAQVAATNSTVEVVGIYEGSEKRIRAKCRTCGYEWPPIAQSLISGYGCPKCSGRVALTQEEFVSRLADVNPSVEVLGDYTNARSRIRVRCLKCGHVWAPSAYSLTAGYGYPECKKTESSARQRMSKSEFESKLCAVNSNIAVKGTYTTASKPVKVHCKKCGNDWMGIPNNLLRGAGCPVCARSGTSYMEQFFLESLRLVLGKDKVLSRDRSAIGKELDIYIPSLSLAFEPGSWFWHKDKLHSDADKRSLCAQAGIRLITIYDDYPDGAEPPFDRDCLTINGVVSAGSNERDLERIVADIMSEYGITCCFSPQETAAIFSSASSKSQRMIHDEFVEELHGINPDIEVVGRYTYKKNRILVRCRVCGHEWKPIAQSLVRGSGCPRCAGALKLTETEFKDRLEESNPSIEYVGGYKGNSKRVNVRCMVCGHEWSPFASSLLRGHGCPKCAGVLRRTQDQFVREVSEKHPDIEILGEYKSSSTVILVLCKTCGYEWSPKAETLLTGGSCPNCRRLRMKKARPS